MPLKDLQLVLFVVCALSCCAGPAWSNGITLGDECNRDRECEVEITNSHCHLGFCRCLPFFAQYNGTHCLESTLLGNDCLVDEQCTLKVANSGCFGGVCGCKDGYLRFRRHTCLAPAKLGEVCYEHAHCRLWESESHCDFLIPDLFGRCQCTAPMRREGDACQPDSLVRPPPLVAAVDTTASDNVTDQEQDQENPYGDTGVQISWLKNQTQETTPEPAMRPVFVPVATSAVPVARDPAGAEADDNDAVVIEASPDELPLPEASPSPLVPMKTDRHEPTTYTPVSLGLACRVDAECRMADPHSQCLEGVCDCAVANATTCSARKRGCAAGTFQCRGSGRCVSWFFVCDGRADCADGSDEECADARSCPPAAFRCNESGVCISRAGQCDGHRDCPHGEDELGCNDRRRCPPGAFRCNNGQCLPAYEFCNAEVSCRDGSDEPRELCRTRTIARVSHRFCPFRCDNGRCRSDAITCSGRDGCGDNSDEKRCTVCRCPATAP